MDWSNSFITDAGIALLGKIQKGAGIFAVRAEAGTGLYPEDEVRQQTALKEKKQEISVVGETSVSKGKKIHLLIENTALENGYKMQQVGIWMKVDGEEEVLFSIQQDTEGVDIPSRNDIPEFVLDFYVVLEFSNIGEFVLSYDPTALVSRELLEQVRDEVPDILVGGAALVGQLGSPGLLVVTDEEDPLEYLVTLEQVLAEGDKASRGEADGLENLLTVDSVRGLNWRKDSAGNGFTEEDLPGLGDKIRSLCDQAQQSGAYVSSGNTCLSWNQVQYWLIFGELVSHGMAAKQEWFWAERDVESELLRLRQEVSEIRAMLGDVNAGLDEVLDGTENEDGEEVET